jgi:hypothetical protein
MPDPNIKLQYEDVRKHAPKQLCEYFMKKIVLIPHEKKD